MLKFGRDIVRAHVESVALHFYINEPIVDPDDYIDLIDALYQGQPNHTIYIHLNTPGGNLDVALQIINAISSSAAEVVGIADGQVSSAGSLILFACPMIGVQDFSYVMMHDGSEGAGGKVNENLKQAQFTSKLLHKVCHRVYGPYFTVEEIDAILDGRDMWLQAEEVSERLNNSIKQEEEEEVGEE